MVIMFAYGQTGTGKTFTMEGTPENKGVNYKTLEELFRVAGERGGVMKYELFVSMMEFRLRWFIIRSDVEQAADGTEEVPGVVEASVYNTEEAWELLKSGNKVRSVGATNANEMSSRSHRERVGKIDVEGERLKESQFINKSISPLGDVISALASKTSHIPYRFLPRPLFPPSPSCMNNSYAQPNKKSICLASINPFILSAFLKQELNAHTYVTELSRWTLLSPTKKLQDNVQSLQLRLSAREHTCKSLQEKWTEHECLCSLKFTVDEAAILRNGLSLVFRLRSERKLGDRDIGTVQVPFGEKFSAQLPVTAKKPAISYPPPATGYPAAEFGINGEAGDGKQMMGGGGSMVTGLGLGLAGGLLGGMLIGDLVGDSYEAGVKAGLDF
ncbi:Detected protein of confused Function [Hibiscus syriacus]|uniref:Detected protein of confused Function n=1 Tax=Hibiscus syriacus TaxID=106335 RepID=A0A6A2X5F4_HIBSY|nr:Detected protein of confused Function [Hibiscus syriacus]